MFVVLDSNHYREFATASGLGARLRQRMDESLSDAFISIITVHEATQGWLAEINRRKPGKDQIKAYRQFQDTVDGFALITVLAFDAEAAAEFHRLQALRLQVGTMDLKIAAIAVSHDALLLSRNLVDFNKVPGLRVENWLD